jgi:cellulose binding protein with CBM2 domain
VPTPRLLLAAALALALLPAAPAHAAPAISCDYRFSAWSNGFMADLYITNHGPDITGWTARWTFNEPTTNITVWQANLSVRDGREAIATNAVYNGLIRNGQTLSFGWSATAASTSRPADITVNGTPC